MWCGSRALDRYKLGALKLFMLCIHFTIMMKAINIFPKNVHGVHERKIVLTVFNCTENFFFKRM